MKPWIVGLLVFVAGCGGTPPAAVLVYEAAPLPGSGDDAVAIEPLLTAVYQRINPGGTSRIRVRQTQDNTFEVLIFEDDPRAVERVERLLASPGTLEFRILANRRDHASIIERALADRADVLRAEDKCGANVVLAWWVPLLEGDREADKRRVEGIRCYPEIATRAVEEGGKKVPQVLVVKDSLDVTGQYLLEATAGTDQSGRPCVHFRLTEQGGRCFTALTGNNLPEQDGKFTRKLGIIIDGRVFSAPSIQSVIADRGEITGEFTHDEVKDLAAALSSGAMPAKLTLIEKRVGRAK